MNERLNTLVLPRLTAFLLGLFVAIAATGDTRSQDSLDLRKRFQDGIPRSPCIEAIYGYADAMVASGRDAQGPQSTGVFLSALDRDSLQPLTTRPRAPSGVDERLRPGPPGKPLSGANPVLDQNLYRLLYFLKGLSGDSKYPAAADEALAWFLKNSAAATQGRFPWGAVGFWDTKDDQAVVGAPDSPLNIPRPWMLWEECFRLAPKATLRHVEALRAAASSDTPSTRRDARVLGFRLRAWIEAWAHSRDGAFVDACHRSLNKVAERLFTDGSLSPRELLSLAIDVDGAARKAPEPLRGRLRALARRLDAAFLRYDHDLESEGGGFVLATSDSVTPPRTRTWGADHRQPTTAQFALLCVSRYENTGDVRYRRLIVEAADRYRVGNPGESLDEWPSTIGYAIGVQLAAFRVTAEKPYFERATELGILAVERFFDGSPLPRASTRSDHYESTTGADTLVLALIELHLTTMTITAVRVPAYNLDR